MSAVRDHWESIYETRRDDELSWTQTDPSISMALIREVCPAGGVIDVGGGSSQLAGRLLDAGYSVAVLDISETALARARKHLGARADEVRWIAADVTSEQVLGTFDLWHDRALFHFLTTAAARKAYRGFLARTLRTGGHAVIATFALSGPSRCSGLDVQRYDGPSVTAELGPEFVRLKSVQETHQTPWGATQLFEYTVLRRL